MGISGHVTLTGGIFDFLDVADIVALNDAAEKLAHDSEMAWWDAFAVESQRLYPEALERMSKAYNTEADSNCPICKGKGGYPEEEEYQGRTILHWTVCECRWRSE